MPRNHRQGLTTLATLAAVLLLAILTLTLQTRTAASCRVSANPPPLAINTPEGDHLPPNQI